MASNGKKKAVFYHAGCPVCAEAEHNVVEAIDRGKFDVENVHLGGDKSRLREAEEAGVKSVPALVLDGTVFHVNYGASIDDLK